MSKSEASLNMPPRRDGEGEGDGDGNSVKIAGRLDQDDNSDQSNDSEDSSPTVDHGRVG